MHSTLEEVLIVAPHINVLSLLMGAGACTEFSWRHGWGAQLVSHMQGVLADVSIATGYVTIALMMGGRLVFDYLGWATAAFITPTVLLLFGGAFFAFSLSGSASTASWAVFAGAITQVCPAPEQISLDPSTANVLLRYAPPPPSALLQEGGCAGR